MRSWLTRLLSSARWAPALALLAGCGGTLDAGSDSPDPSALPMSAESTFVVSNDGPTDNWQGELMVLLAANGVEFAGLVINDSWPWPELDTNLSGWQDMLHAAAMSGVDGLPKPTPSVGPPLVKPASGEISDTEPNHSEGAELIVRAAFDAPNPPLVVITGGRLTDVADAYLVEPAIANRIVVVASLGELSEQGATMGVPNGEMDPWANTIVVEQLRYVQVSGRYDQHGDVPESRLPELPQNAFGEWIAGKYSKIFESPVASDQVALLTAAIPGFALHVDRSQQDGTAPVDLGDTPILSADDEGSVWLVSQVDGELATRTFWHLLSKTF